MASDGSLETRDIIQWLVGIIVAAFSWFLRTHDSKLDKHQEILDALEREKQSKEDAKDVRDELKSEIKDFRTEMSGRFQTLSGQINQLLSK